VNVRAHRPALVAVAVVALLACGGSLYHGFVWDDRPLIVENRQLREPGGLASLLSSGFWQTGDHHDRFRAFYRPLVSLSYALDTAVWGRAPSGFHVTNLLLHLAAALLVYALACRREAWPAAAAFGAALFAGHPVHVESVAWISGRTDLLCTVLCLAAFLLDRVGARRARTSGARRAAALACFFLALLAKEMAVTLPLLLGLDRFLRPGRPVARLRIAARAMAPYLVIAAGYVVLRRVVLGFEADPLVRLDPLGWLATAIFVLARDATLLLLPLGLDPHYPYPPRTTLLDPVVVLSGVLLAIVIAAGVVAARGSRRAAFALAWIAVTLAPVLRFGTFGDVLLADRFLYLPSVGAALLAARAIPAVAACASLRLRRAGAAAAFLVVGGLTLLAARQTAIWRDDLTLFTRLARTSPGSAMVRSNLGLALYDAGDYDRAVAEYRTAIDLAPGFALAHNNLAAALDRGERLAEAERHYQEALRLAPRQLESRINLANLRVRRGHAEEVADLRAIVRDRPGHARARYALADALMHVGRPDEAAAEAGEALRRDPSLAEAWYLIGRVRYEQGRTDEAAGALRAFLEGWPANDAHRRAAADLVARITPPRSPRQPRASPLSAPAALAPRR
jgi:tetratricopeptide (TPR) repeat protein